MDPDTDQLIRAISDTEFEQEINAIEDLVLVDYWAEWCGPCKMIEPQLQEIASEYKDQLKVYKLNIDHNPLSAQQYGIRGIPTLLLFRDGQVQDTRVGALNKGQLKAFIEDHL